MKPSMRGIDQRSKENGAEANATCAMKDVRFNFCYILDFSA